MSEPPVIRSRANALLKQVGAVSAGKERGLCLLEGDRLIEDARAAGWRLEVVLCVEERLDRARELETAGETVRLVERAQLERVSELETSPGILALAAAPAGESVPLDPVSAPRVLVVAGVADPGNLGAIARSAEAAGFADLVVVSGGARPFGSKALRGSMGSLLRLRVREEPDGVAVACALAKAGYRQVAPATRGGTDWRSFDWSTPLAFWVDSETGEGDEAAADFERVSIPMAGRVESLNVAVATSLLLFAAGGAP